VSTKRALALKCRLREGAPTFVSNAAPLTRSVTIPEREQKADENSLPDERLSKNNSAKKTGKQNMHLTS